MDKLQILKESGIVKQFDKETPWTGDKFEFGVNFFLIENEKGTYFAIYNNCMGGSNVKQDYTTKLSKEELRELEKKEAENDSLEYLPETLYVIKDFLSEFQKIN